MKSLPGSSSSVMIWSRYVCILRGGLAGEDGGLRRWVDGCGGGVGDLLFVRDGVYTRGLRVVVVGPGGSTCPRSGIGRVVSVSRKASTIATSPRRMVRMWVGSCGEGANCTMHMVSGGRRSEVLGLPLGRLVAVAAWMRGVGTLASRLVIEVMTKPCACTIQ